MSAKSGGRISRGGIIGKLPSKKIPKAPPRKPTENVGPLGFKTHQRPEDRPRKV